MAHKDIRRPLGRRSIDAALVCGLMVLTASTTALAEDTGGAGGFEPSMLALGVTGLFALATLGTGLVALLGNRGLSILIDTRAFVRSDDGATVHAPNVRGWGARQAVTGVTLWAALILGSQVLFQVGLASMLIRQVLDMVANALDGAYARIVPYVAAAGITAPALYAVL